MTLQSAKCKPFNESDLFICGFEKWTMWTVERWTQLGAAMSHIAHKIIYMILKVCQEKCELKYS